MDGAECQVPGFHGAVADQVGSDRSFPDVVAADAAGCHFFPGHRSVSQFSAVHRPFPDLGGMHRPLRDFRRGHRMIGETRGGDRTASDFRSHHRLVLDQVLGDAPELR